MRATLERLKRAYFNIPNHGRARDDAAPVCFTSPVALSMKLEKSLPCCVFCVVPGIRGGAEGEGHGEDQPPGGGHQQDPPPAVRGEKLLIICRRIGCTFSIVIYFLYTGALEVYWCASSMLDWCTYTRLVYLQYTGVLPVC